jgi:hypothetical protein
MVWFKLVGTSKEPVPPKWAVERPDLFCEIRFPWNKPPRDLSNGEQIIVYAVGTRVLIASQTIDGPPRLRPRRGPIGSPQNRWPHSISVKTEFYCSPLSSAPVLREVAPDFTHRYASRFRDGSHWRIEHDEYALLAAAIEASGRSYGT